MSTKPSNDLASGISILFPEKSMALILGSSTFPKSFTDCRLLGYKEKEQVGARTHDQHGPGVLRWMSHTRYNLNNLSLILFQTYLMPHSFPSIHAFARVPWH